MSARIHIENDRLLIRSLREQDLDRLKAMKSDKRIYQYEPAFLTELQGSPEEALRSMQEMDLDRDRQCVWGIFEKTDPDTLVGLAELYDYKPSGKVISMGYRLMTECWGRGIASCCNRALVDFIKNNTQVELVTAHVFPENTASSHILLKNGFEYLLTKTEDWGYSFPCVADVYTLDL
ncbi:MAG: GNAT family N-acetyltransferase [Parasporobacterium sp.]|nr:GNAT family N-acetyltransferase [Parasporobacterium sp.]